MNRGEAKQILIIYRPGTSDADDPEIAEALALVRRDPELSRWFDEHCALQTALRDKFRQIAPPAALKEQIISEHTARTKASQRERVVGVTAVAAILVALALVAFHWWPQKSEQPYPRPNTLANYHREMVTIALNSYAMTAMTNLDQVHSWLAQNKAPSDYVLPAGLKKVAVTGCAVEPFRSATASLICFRKGNTLPPGQAGDLWLFVIDQTAVQDAPATASPQFTPVNGLMTATWTQNGKLYLLATKGDEQAIQKFL
ncbi:MAG TPA: hypothetical protein VMF08_14780 [Candidatus Sulfotelmatobacter sp.]|nr:hypothetical protein [Candidatus Sulfotelmatobacter sp.]